MDKTIDPCEGCRRSCEIPCWKVEHGLLVSIEASILNRVAGIIEGVSHCIDEKPAYALSKALDMLDGLLKGGQDI